MHASDRFSVFASVICATACLGTMAAAALLVEAGGLIFFILPILFVPYFASAGWAFFMFSKGRMRPIPTWLALILTAVGIPFCAYFPNAIASHEMMLRAADLPTHPDLKVSSVFPDTQGNSMTGPGVVFRLDAQASALPAVHDLADQLVTDGWKVVAGGVPGARGSDFGVWFSGPVGQSLSLTARWNRTRHVYEDITLRHNFSPISPGLILLVLMAVALVSMAYGKLNRSKPKYENAS